MKFEKDTSGVILLCSKKGLKNYFLDKTFDYDFPDGILPLVNKGIIGAIVTETGEDVKGEILVMKGMNDKEGYDLCFEGKFFIEEDDELFILSHSEFTQICDDKKGDIDQFSFWDDKISISNLKSGWCILFIHTKVSDEDEDNMLIDVIFQLTHLNSEPPFEDSDEIPSV